MFSAQIVVGGTIRADIITDDFYDVDGNTIALPPGTAVGSKVLAFNNAILSVGGLLIWEHNLNNFLTAVRIKFLDTGTGWQIPWDEPNSNTIRVDFSNIYPIPGNWEIRIFAA